MILASKLRSTTERDIGGQFIIGNAKVIPNLSGVYKQGQEVGVYLQVYNAGIDQTTLRPAVDVEYVLSKAGKEVFRQPEDWSGLSDSGVLDTNPLDFYLRIDFFRQSEDRVIATFTVQTENKELTFKDEGGLETARMNIFGRITAVSGKRSGIFEDSVTTNATREELAEARDRKSVYQKAVALTPGTYKVDVVVRDVDSGNRGIVNMGFSVTRYD